MTYTLEEVLEKLKQMDEVSLLELLGASSEDLVARFDDWIEDDLEKFDAEVVAWFGDETDD